MVEFPSETMKAKWNNIIKVLKKNCQNRVIHSGKISFRKNIIQKQKQNTDIFGQRNLRNLVTSRTTL